MKGFICCFAYIACFSVDCIVHLIIHVSKYRSCCSVFSLITCTVTGMRLVSVSDLLFTIQKFLFTIYKVNQACLSDIHMSHNDI